MKTEILVRYFTPHLGDQFRQVAALIARETDYRVTLIDHTTISLEDFDIGSSTPISLDAYLGARFDIETMQVSRIFRNDGSIMGRQIVIPEGLFGDDLCVIDTDMVYGTALELARRVLGTFRYSVPLRVQEHQDLIDIEDLVWPLSLLENGERCSYLISEEFFSLRTSLPKELYRPMMEIAHSVVFDPKLHYRASERKFRTIISLGEKV